MKINDQIIHFIFLVICILLFIDGYVVRKKLEIVEVAASKLGLDIEKLEENIHILKDDVVKNSDEDERFREQQAKLDNNLMRLLREVQIIK